MGITSKKFNEIKLYGLDNHPKICRKCERLNNSANTLCWYCNLRFETQAKGE